MATQTQNLNLTKPNKTDFYNVDDFNGNMDTIDKEISALDSNPENGMTIPVVFGTNIFHPTNYVDYVYSGIINIPGIDKFNIRFSNDVQFYEEDSTQMKMRSNSNPVVLRNLPLSGESINLPQNSFYIGLNDPYLAGKQCFLTLYITKKDNVD